MKKYWWLILFLALLIGYDFIKTYSLFESNITVPSQISLAKWEISVNDTLIGTNTSFDVDNIIWDDSTYVIEGKAAPGRTGHFNISINPNTTQVAYRYDITIQNSSVFELVSVKTADDTLLKKTDKNTYSAIVTLDDIDKGIVSDVQVNVIWNNLESNNELDTSISENRETIVIPVSISFSQYFGEELVEYTE